MTAHPRSRGENLRLYGLGAMNEGSSPLTRGKPRPTRASRSKRGLIPAHAGKTDDRSSPGSPRRAHPRSRGENLRLYGLGAMNEGSSPLTRGKHMGIERLRTGRGLIPAHAGKTASRPVNELDRWAHPRSRGENFAGGVDFGGAGGSSPLTRGKPSCSSLSRPSTRLIPAHAGKTHLHYTSRSVYRAHPRSRGENHTPRNLIEIPGGSSPLTRGKPRTGGTWTPSRGLIPAHAGKTTIRSARSARPWAHPRSRGENDDVGMFVAEHRGSSPLTRGKHAKALEAKRIEGLIPAHAGKTARDALSRA